MSGRNAIEIQFNDGSFFVLRSHYADTCHQLARKLMKAKVLVKGGDVADYVTGIAVHRDEKLTKAYGNYDPKLN